MDLMKEINDIKCAAICGIGFQTETIAMYFKTVLKKECIVIINCFTQKPEDCFKIPSKRNGKRNSFSEVDLLMDTQIEDVPIKRFDMLTEYEKEKCTFFFFQEQNHKLYMKT